MTGATTGILQCNPPSKREEIPHRPQAVDDGSAKTAVFALQKIQFSNDRFWRIVLKKSLTTAFELILRNNDSIARPLLNHRCANWAWLDQKLR